MNEPTRRAFVWVALVVIVLATAAVSIAAVASASSAALREPARRQGAAGARLTDNDRGVAALELSALVPGQVSGSCIEVTYYGDPTTLISMRVFGRSSGALTPYMSLAVQQGEVGATCDVPGGLSEIYRGGLDDFGTDFATGSEAAVPTVTDEAIPFLFQVGLDELTPNSAQGARATLDLWWEVRAGNGVR